MENASKALIIAGAILLSILIIAIGMYIYNSSQNSIQEAGSQISAQEIQSFNQGWEMYEGKQSGSNVRALLNKLNANATENADEATRLPDVYYEASEGVVETIISEPVSSSNTAHPKGAEKNDFNTARAAIETRHVYGVTLVTHTDTGLISGVIITYNPDDDATDLTVYDQFAGITSGS